MVAAHSHNSGGELWLRHRPAGLEAAPEVGSNALPAWLALGRMQKNGAKFEGMVRTKEIANPLFAFLHPSSQHHQRYRSVACWIGGRASGTGGKSGGGRAG